MISHISGVFGKGETRDKREKNTAARKGKRKQGAIPMKQRKKALPTPKNEKVIVAYEPTPKEREVVEAIRAAVQTRSPALRCIERENGISGISVDHPEESVGWVQLMNACATTSFPFMEKLVDQVSNAVSIGRKPDQAAINFAFDVVEGVKPRDQLETLLAVQMAAIHMATITFARKLAHVENIQQQDSAERALNKLARTFATQMETLKRYRTGGEQKVTVHHVTVNEGGQAIVGTVERPGAGGGG